MGRLGRLDSKRDRAAHDRTPNACYTRKPSEANRKAAGRSKGRVSLARGFTVAASFADRQHAGTVQFHQPRKCQLDDIECSATCIFVKEWFDLERYRGG